jgi:hypothetical protein
VTATELRPGEERVVDVAARPRWTATGVVLVCGGRYRASAEGGWDDRQVRTDAAGYASPNLLFRLLERFRRHPRARWFALVGTVDRRRATRVVLGTVAEFTAPATGELVCYANDLLPMLFNNSGSVRLTVVRTA